MEGGAIDAGAAAAAAEPGVAAVQDAAALQASSTQGVGRPSLTRLQFSDVVGVSEDEGEEDEEGEQDDEEGMEEEEVDERGLAFPATGTRFRAVKRSTMRAESDLSSAKLGHMEAGEIDTALEFKLAASGQLRVRFAKGWVSMATKRNEVLLEPLSASPRMVARAGAGAAQGGRGRRRRAPQQQRAGQGGQAAAVVATAGDGGGVEDTSCLDDSVGPAQSGAGRADDGDGGENEPRQIEDEPGQLTIQPCWYMAVKKANVRLRSALDSEPVGSVEKAALIYVTHTKDVKGTPRLRFEGGWTSATGSDGRTIFIAENNPNLHYRAKRTCTVTAHFDSHSEKVGTVAKNSVIETVESREVLPRGDRPRHRLRLVDGGWTTEVAKNGDRLLKLVSFQRPGASPQAPPNGITTTGQWDSPRKMIKRSGISSGVTVTFGKGPIGIGMAENLEWCSASAVGAFSTVVERFNLMKSGSAGPAEKSGRVHIGDLVVAVSGADVRGEEHFETLARIRACPRPFTITFCEPRLLAGLVLEHTTARQRRLSDGAQRRLQAVGGGAQPHARVRRLSGGSFPQSSQPWLNRRLSIELIPGDARRLSGALGGLGGVVSSNHHSDSPPPSRGMFMRTRSDEYLSDDEVDRRSITSLILDDIALDAADEIVSNNGSSRSVLSDAGYSTLVERAGSTITAKPGDEISGRIDMGDCAPAVAYSGGLRERDFDALEEPLSGGSCASLGGISVGSVGSFSNLGPLRSFDRELGHGQGTSWPTNATTATVDNPLAAAATAPGAAVGILGGPATMPSSSSSASSSSNNLGGPGIQGGSGGGGGGGQGKLGDAARVGGATPGANDNSVGSVIITELEILEKKGMLSKRGRIRKSWKPRYFVLSKATLRYYEHPDATVPLGAISLRGAIIEEVAFNEFTKLYCFSAKTADGERALFMHASTKQSMEEWINIMTVASAFRGDAADDHLHDEIVNAPTLSTNLRSMAGRAWEHVERIWVDKAVPVLTCSSCRGEDELWTTGFSHTARVGVAGPGGGGPVGPPQPAAGQSAWPPPPPRLANVSEELDGELGEEDDFSRVSFTTSGEEDDFVV